MSYYLDIFVKNRRVFLFSGILFFGFFVFWADTLPAETESAHLGIFMPIFGFLSSLFVFLVAMGVREIEKLDEKTFWYTYLSLLIGVMMFLIPTVLLLMFVENISREVPFLILGILSAIPFQIPVVLKYRRYLYFFSRKHYMPDPCTMALGFALYPGAMIFSLILVIRAFGPDYIGWINLGYFPCLLICILTFLLSLFLSHHRTLKVIENDGKEKFEGIMEL